MRKRITPYLVIFLILAVAGLAVASYKRGFPCKDRANQQACCAKRDGGSCLIDCGNLPGPGLVLKARSELELTESQVTQLKALKLAAKKEKVRLKADIKILKLELAELLDKKVVDKTTVDAKVDEIAQLSAKCAKQCIQTKLDTRQLLTEEQLKQVEDLKATCPLSQSGAEGVAPQSQAGFATSAKKSKCSQNK